MAIYQIESLNLIIKTNTTNKTKKCKVPHAKKKTKLISLFMTLFTFNLYVYDRKTFIYRVLTMDIEYPESTYTFKHILASYYRCFCFAFFANESIIINQNRKSTMYLIQFRLGKSNTCICN